MGDSNRKIWADWAVRGPPLWQYWNERHRSGRGQRQDLRFVRTQLTIDRHNQIARVQPKLYSHFIEHLGDCTYPGIWVGQQSPVAGLDGLRRYTVEKLRGVSRGTVYRWPGGCFADHYHWREGIGDPAKRPVTRNIWWGGPETNQFGTHEFMRFAQELGADTYVCGNIGSGTPSEMMDWLEYCNAAEGEHSLARQRAANGHPAPFGVKWWGVGNENWGCGGTLRAEEYAAAFRRYANYLGKIRQGAQLVAVGHTPEWNRRFLSGLRGERSFANLDHLSLHRYLFNGGPDVGFGDEDYYALISELQVVEDDLIRADGILAHHEDPGKPIGIVFDEWGVWCRSVARPENGVEQINTVREAICGAVMLDYFTNYSHRVAMSNVAQTVNVLQCLVKVDGHANWTTPNLDIFEFYRSHVGNDAVAVADDGPQLFASGDAGRPVRQISASVSIAPDGSSGSLCLTNLHLTESIRIRARVVESAVVSSSARVLSSGDPGHHNSANDPDRVRSQSHSCRTIDGELEIDVPPHATVQAWLELAA